MSNASNGRSQKKRKTAEELEKPFQKSLYAKAKNIAAEYSIVLQPHAELGFMGSSVEIPTVFTHGKTEQECARLTREALALAVAVMLEEGEAPPAAATEHRRDQQLNIRLTSEERMVLESAAKRRGFRGISDFVRTAALEQTRRSA